MKNTTEALIWITNILNGHHIPFQVVGGLAVMAYGSSRELYDIDIEMPEECIEKIYSEVLPYITFGPAQLKGERWDLFLMTLKYKNQEIDISASDNTKIYNLKDKIWITLEADLSKVNYLNIYDVNLPVIDRDALIAYKKILSRPVDLLDIEFLEIRH